MKRLVDFLDRNLFNYLVKKYGGDRYVKHFTCWNQLLVMMFGQNIPPAKWGQTFLKKVKTPIHNPTNTLSSPTVVGVGKELVGVW